MIYDTRLTLCFILVDIIRHPRPNVCCLYSKFSIFKQTKQTIHYKIIQSAHHFAAAVKIVTLAGSHVT